MVQRTLWYEAKDRRIKLPQSELDGRVEPLVILGEAGMGKSHYATGSPRCQTIRAVPLASSSHALIRAPY